jgi:hypothetical protein
LGWNFFKVFPLTLTLSLQGREKKEIVGNMLGREMVDLFEGGDKD